jgi:hypothetical protein
MENTRLPAFDMDSSPTAELAVAVASEQDDGCDWRAVLRG